MIKSLQVLVVVGLCILAVGAQWNLVQVVAWGRMIAGNSRTMGFSQAVQKTFGGEMCGLCRVVTKATQDDDQASMEPANGKVDLFWQAAACQVCGRLPVDEDWMRVTELPFCLPRPEPLTPPPRWC